MRHFFKFAMFRQIKNIVAAVMQVIAAFTHGAERRIARRNARKCHRFFGLMTWVLFCRIVVSLMLSSSFVGSRYFRCVLFHLATGKQVVELRFVLVVVDAFVQLVAGLHGIDDAFLRTFLAQDVVDMLSGAVHGAER